MDAGTLAIGNVALVPLIVALIQFMKRIVERDLGRVWLLVSFVLGIIGEAAVFFMAQGETFTGWTFGTWAAAVVTGLWFGLAAAKAYDEAAGSSGAVGRAVRALAGQNGYVPAAGRRQV